MADNQEVVYTFTAEDGISGPMKKAEEQLAKTEQASETCTQAQERAILKSVETLSALHAVQSGMSAVTSSVQTLGLVDEETFQSLRKVTAGIQLVVGTAEAVKGVVTLFNTLNGVLKTTAIVSTFAAIAENPLKGAAIVGAAGVAAGAVAGYMYSATQNNNTTITVSHADTETGRRAEEATGSWY
jgi:hypothetical protein